MSVPVESLNLRQYTGLQKLGDAFAPGDGELPRFSELGCAEHVDSLFAEMPASDAKDLAMLLWVFSWFPGFALKGVWWILESTQGLPGPVGALLRFLRLGLKGLVTTLYYSGKKGRSYTGKSPHEVIGYQVGVYTADL